LLILLVFLMIATGVSIIADSGRAEATTSPACYGSVVCNGQDPTTLGCAGTELESLLVTGLGHLQLFESGVCDSAWATLTLDQSGPPGYADEAFFDSDTMIAEILYEPPQGGVEQYSTVPWNSNEAPSETSPFEVLTTPMVPMSGSFKACAGSPDGSGDPFDMDPQGVQEFVQNPAASTAEATFSLGGCTEWH
jgi:hypothetical protein